MLQARLVRLLFLCASLLVGFSLLIPQVFAQASSFAEFKADIDYIRSQSEAVLLFTPLGTNPDPRFAKHRLSDAQITELCGSDCSNLGINWGTVFKGGDYTKLSQFGMKWALEIANQKDPGSVAEVIKTNPQTNVIVRIGITDNSIGFADHTGNATDYIAFLRDVYAQSGNKPFYAIAGPNEADIEKWIKPECGAAPGTYDPGASEQFYSCIGEVLAKYMNQVCAAGLPEDIKILSPAFNMTSYTFSKSTPAASSIVHRMDEAGANWSCLDGVAGNLYPAGKSMQNYWNDAFTGESIKFFKSKGLPIYITETGPANAEIATDNPAASANLEDFYIHPILGLAEKNKDLIRDDLIRQGYEARCATPGFQIQLEQEGVDWLERYLKCKGPGDCNDRVSVNGSQDDGQGDGAVFGGQTIDQFTDNLDPDPLGSRVISILSVDYRDSLIPVLRDFDKVPQLKRSLEDYFGYKEGPQDLYNLAELKSAPINSLLSTEQRCTQSALSLLQRDEMCQKLQDPTKCALYNAQVPQANLTVKELLDSYTAAAGISTDHAATCRKIIGGADTPLRTGMLSLPLQIEHSYRLAFLVTTIRTRIPTLGNMMNLFQHPKRGPLGIGPDPAHLVVVTAFKVPDITTNKGTIEGDTVSGHTDFNDPAMLTRDILIPHQQKLEFDKQGDVERQRLLNMGRLIATEQQDDNRMEIQCKLSGIGSQQCLDHTTGALVDIINAQSVIETENQQALDSLDQANESAINSIIGEQAFKLDCDDTPTEEPSVIFDPGDLHELNNPGRVFKTNYGVAILENIFTDDSHLRPEDLAKLDPTYGDTEGNKKSGESGGGFHWGLKSVFHVVQGNTGSTDTTRSVKHFIVYPEGYDLKSIEAVMSGTFFSSAQIEALRDKAAEYERFAISGDKVEFDGGEISSGNFKDKTVREDGMWCDERYERVRNDGTIDIEEFSCPEGSFSFALDVDKDPRHASILGGRLGYWLHTIQQSLHRASALTHKYLENCTSTEDFLLDQCGGDSTSQVAAGTDLDPDFNNIPNFEITYWNGSTVTFQPPSREVWDAIQSASQQHGCDPWLVLATAHGESPTFTNAAVPNSEGELGLFQFNPKTWEKWKTENDAPKASPPLSPSCNFWQPPSFSSQGHDFSSPTNIRAAVDSACRRILWTGMQNNPPPVGEAAANPENDTNLPTFVQRFTTQGQSGDEEVWNPGAGAQGEYVYKLWKELLNRSKNSPFTQSSSYPYTLAQCTGTPPEPTGNNNAVNYFGRTELPVSDGVATFYSPRIMNNTWKYRSSAEINPALINNCEIVIEAANVAEEFAQLAEAAERNGQLKVVGCAAMLRLGDIPFYKSQNVPNPSRNGVRLIWIQKPSGAPSEMPMVIGPIAVIDVARDIHAVDIFNRYQGKWVVDLDYYTFERLFGWRGGWQRPQHNLKVCDTEAQCR